MKKSLPKKPKVLLALSGGVDSAVAGYLLLKAGYEVEAVFLNFWKDPQETQAENRCCSYLASQEARQVAEQLKIPFHVYDFSKLFKKKVVDYFLQSYSRGETPNPCVVCNREVKIGALLETAVAWGFSYLATGHYAQVKDGRLYQARDEKKDQSYFLHYLTRAQLKKTIFPLGSYTKTQVRAIAQKQKLVVAQKAESQEVCFVSGNKDQFLQRNLTKLSSGKIVDTQGKVLGEHQGLELYTLGQRKGLQIGGTGPYYVVSKKKKTGDLVVANNLATTGEIKVSGVNWLVKPLKKEFSATLATRYHQKPERCIIEVLPGKKFVAKFSRKIKSPAPGQSAVVYKNNQILGGGFIS